MYRARRSAAAALLLAALLAAACHESVEQRAEREAREYTRKYCPTPASGCTRTDSVVFYPATRTYTYYCTLTDQMDDPAVVARYRDRLRQQLRAALEQSTSLKLYKDAHFTFQYVCHSQRQPQTVLYADKFKF